MRDPLDPPSYDEREDSFDPDKTEGALDFGETVMGEFLGYNYDTEPDTMILRVRVPAGNLKRTLPYRGGRAVVTLEKPR